MRYFGLGSGFLSRTVISTLGPLGPPFPSGFSEYWNAYDSDLINTVTGISIDTWTGTSAVPQILAQATSADQPSFIEIGLNRFQNRIRKANDEYMDAYPTFTGDQTHIIRSDYDVLATLKKDLSHSSLPSYVGANSSNQFELTSDLGTVFTFATTTADTENRSKAWVIRGTNLEFWLDAILIETKDFTDETLTLDRFGAPTDSSTGDTEYLVPSDFAATQVDIEYFNYLRDDLTNEIILVDGLPIIVS